MPAPGSRLGRDFIEFTLSLAYYLLCAPAFRAAHATDVALGTRSFDRLVRAVEALDDGHHA